MTNFIERPKEQTFDIKPNWDKIMKRPDILTPEAQRYYDEYRKSGVKYKVETELEANARKRREERERKRKERAAFYEEGRRKAKQLEEEEKKKKEAEEQKERQEEIKLQQQEDKLNQLEDKEFEKWKKETGIPSVVPGFTARQVFELKNAAGDLLNSSLSTRQQDLVGKKAINDNFTVTATAHIALLKAEKEYNDLLGAKARFENMLSDKQNVGAWTKFGVADELNKIDSRLSELENTLNNPELKQLSDLYVREQYNRWSFWSGMPTRIQEGLEDFTGSSPIKNKAELERLRESRDRARYQQIMREKIDKMKQDNPGKDFWDVDVIEQEIKNAEEENKEYVEKYDDVTKNLSEIDEFFKTSESWKQKRMFYQDNPWYDPNYLKYNIPNLVGSSNSSPEQIAANAIQLAGTVAGMVMSKNPVASYATMQVATAAAIPGQVIGGLDEAYANTGDKKVENLRNYITNPNNVPEKQQQAILQDLYEKSVDYWKSRDVSEQWIADNINLDSEQGINNILKDLVLGNIDSAHPSLQQGIIESNRGLLALYESNVTRTMTGLPVSIAAQLLPWDKTLMNGVKRGFNRFADDVVFAGDDILRYTPEGTVLSQSASSAARREAADAAAGNAGINTFTNGFRKKTAGEAFEKGWDRGSDVADMLGFGYVGHVVGGAAGGTLGAVGNVTRRVLPKSVGRRLDMIEEGLMNKYEKGIDFITRGKVSNKLLLKYGVHSLSNNLVHRMEEATEEGAQHLYAQEDFANKYGFEGVSISELFKNDLKQGGRMFNAILSLTGLTDSPLKNDQEFWNNYKGGFVLGGMSPGAVLNISSDVSNIIKQYKSDKVLQSSIIMNHEANKLSRASYKDVAMETMRGRSHSVMNVFDQMEKSDKNRKEPFHTQETYDEKREDIENVINLTNDRKTRNILEAHGIKYGTEEYATAVADIYTLESQRRQNQKERYENNLKLRQAYGAEFENEIQQLVDSRLSDDELKPHLDKVKDQMFGDYMDDYDEGDYDEQTMRVRSNKLADKNIRENAIRNTSTLSKLVHKANAILGIKAKYNTVDSWYEHLTEDLGIKVLRPDAPILTTGIQKQLEQVKKQLKKFDKQFDENMSDAELVQYLKTIPGINRKNSDKIEELEAINAVLAADERVISTHSDMLYKDLVYNNDTKKYEYNPDEYKYQNDQNRKRFNALKSGKELEEDKEHKRADKKDPTGNVYQRRIKAIIDADKQNEAIDWMIGEIYTGDAVAKMARIQQEEAEKESKKRAEEEEQLLFEAPDETKTEVKNTTKDDKISGKLAENKRKYAERKQRAKDRYARNKNKYKNFRKGSLHSSLPFENLIVEAFNQLIKNVEIGSYKLANVVEDIKDIIDESDFDINEHLPKIKQLYNKAITKYNIKNPDVLNNMSTLEEVLDYGREQPVEDTSKLDQEDAQQDVKNRLVEMQSKIESELSDYYFTFVNTNDGTRIAFNHSAVDKYLSDIDEDVMDTELANLENAARSGKDAFVEYVKQNYGEEYANTYGNYYNVENIATVILIRSRQDESNDSIYMQNAKTVRSLIQKFLETGDQTFIDALVDPSLQLDGSDKFKSDMINLYNKIKDAGYIVYAPDQNIYFTDSDEVLSSTQADIILIDKDGNVHIRDIITSYKDHFERLESKPTRYETQTYIDRHVEANQETRNILIGNGIGASKSIALIPIIYDRRGHHAELQKLIPLSVTNDGVVYYKTEDIEGLRKTYQELIDKTEDPSKYADPYSYNTKADLQQAIDKLSADLRKKDEDDQYEQELENQGDSNPHRRYTYVIEEGDEDKDSVIGQIRTLSQKLDLMLSNLPQQKPKTKAEIDAWIQTAETALELQKFIYELHITNPEIDTTKESELHTNAMEQLYRYYKRNNGEAFEFIPKWNNKWMTEFKEEYLKIYDPSWNLANIYATKIRQITTLIQNRINNGPEIDSLARAFYSTLLNNYFAKLVDSAQNFLNEEMKKTYEGDLNADRYSKDQLRKFDNVFAKAFQNIIDDAKQLIESGKDVFGTQVDPIIINAQNPVDQIANDINSIDITHSSERGGSTTSVAPDRNSQKLYKYIELSNRPNFIKDGIFEFQIYNGQLVLDVKLGNDHYRLTFHAPDGTSAARQYNDRVQSFVNKVITMINFVKKNPQYEIKFDIFRNAGSVTYKGPLNFERMGNFVFKGQGNDFELSKLRLDKSCRLGIVEITLTQNGPLNRIVTGTNLMEPLSVLKGKAVGGATGLNPGSLVFLRENGWDEQTDKNKYLPVKLTNEYIGKENAKLVASLIEARINGITSINGYNVEDLLKLYIYCDRSIQTPYNDIRNLFIFQDGGVYRGNKRIDIAQLPSMLEQTPYVMTAQLLNEELQSSSMSVFQNIKAEFAAGAREVTIPGGMTFKAEDFAPGNTYLGYLISSGKISTNAAGLNFAEINIDNVRLVNKNATVEETADAIIKAADDAAEQQRQASSAVKTRSSLINKLLSGLKNTISEDELQSRNDQELREFGDMAASYFDKVLGENGIFEVVNQIEPVAAEMTKNQRIAGLCQSNIITLLSSAPESTIFHEAFHKVMELLMTSNERQKYYDLYRNAVPNGNQLSEREVAEELTDLFVEYMMTRGANLKLKGIGKIVSKFKSLGHLIGMARRYGISPTFKFWRMWHQVNNGTFASRQITQEKHEEFQNRFGQGLFYQVKNTDTGQTANFSFLSNISDVREMAKSLGYIIGRSMDLQKAIVNFDKFVIDGTTPNKIHPNVINRYCGNDIQDEEQLTDSQRAFREVFKVEERIIQKYENPYKSEKLLKLVKEDKIAGYKWDDQKNAIMVYNHWKDEWHKIDYKNVEKYPKLVEHLNKTKVERYNYYPNFAVLSKHVSDYFASVLTNYDGKLKLNEEDFDEDEDVFRANMDKYDKASYEFNKLDSVSKGVKLFFATVPYVKPGTKPGTFELDSSKTRFGTPSYMPLNEVYSLVVNDLHSIDTVEELYKELEKKAESNGMYYVLFKKFKTLYDNQVVDGKVNYDIEATITNIRNAIKSQKIRFITALSSKDRVNGGIETRIVESSFDSDGRSFPRTWSSFLISGQTGIFSDVRQNGELQLSEEYATQPNIFKIVSQALSQLGKDFASGQQFKIGDNVISPESLSDLSIVKDEILSIFELLGITFTKDALDYMLEQKYGSIGIEGLNKWFNTNSISSSMSTFLDTLNSYVFPNGKVNTKKVEEGYVNLSFVKELGVWQGKTNRMRTQQQVLGLDGKKLYSVSQNNTISQTVDVLNKNDQNDSTLSTIMNFSYNLMSRNGQNVGSILLRALKSNRDFRIVANTYIGFRTDNNGDYGTPYTEEQEQEDYIAKMTMLQNDTMIFPTLADKGTWMCLSLFDNDGTNKGRQSVHIPGMYFQATSQTSSETNGAKTAAEDIKKYENAIAYHIVDAPTLEMVGKEYIIRPCNAVLNQFIEYAYCERQAIMECMDDLGYNMKNVPGYVPTGNKKLDDRDKVVNYHTKRKDGVEPNGTRFWSLTMLKIKNADGSWRYVNLNNPNKSSQDLLKLANEEFFSKSLKEQQDIIAWTLSEQNKLEVEKAVQLGIVQRVDVKTSVASLDRRGNGLHESADNKDTFRNLDTNKLNNNQIEALKEKFMQEILNSMRQKSPNAKFSSQYLQTLNQVARSLAIAAILGDVTNRSIICAQETDRLFVGHPAFFKTFYDEKAKFYNDEEGIIKDCTSDKQKRIGGLVSTGEDNRTDLPGVKDHYVCAELDDYKISSKCDVSQNIKEWFYESILRETYGSVTKKWKDAYSISTDEIEAYLKTVTYSDNDSGKNISVAEKARINAERYAKSYLGEGKINVADGASYISEEMCETMLRMRGAYSNKVREAFELLRGHRVGKYSNPYEWRDQAEAYKVIYEAVNIVTTKYTAYGFRGHDKGKIAIPYYNKTALFPLFDCIATGPMYDIYQKMRNEGVDMLMMTSAIKIGSEGSSSYKEGRDLSEPFHTYIQSYKNIRRQLNTDPEEEAEARAGTQMIKIVLQNLHLGRRYSNGKTGKQLLEEYMRAIEQLSNIGEQELLDKFYNESGEIDMNKLSEYLVSQMSDRNASQNLIEALQLNENGDNLNAPLAATQESSWIESILISTVNSKVIDVVTPGSSFTQRSIFAVEGSTKYGENSGAIIGQDIYDGNELQMINEKGSMDAVISIDYFEHILPKGLSFNEAREWLISNGIIGRHAESNTIGYRIPTQAQSSIHALRFVDVVPATKATIILPKEFTAITGSDFDIDHLYLMSYAYHKTDETITIGDKELPRVSRHKPLDVDNDRENKTVYQNELIDIMMVLLHDNKMSLSSTYRSIDNDTSLVEGIAAAIPNTENISHVAYNYGTLHEQVTRRNDYITGKNGIGPYALNVTNHILTRLYNVKFEDCEFTRSTGISSLDAVLDDNYNPVNSWLSAFINAHVDIVKDPYISKVNINQYTYNITNLLVRCGFGDVTMWFVCQPVIRELARIDNQFRSKYMKDFTSASRDAMITDALTKLGIVISPEELASFNSKKGIKDRIRAVNSVLKNPKVLKAIALNPTAQVVKVDGEVYKVKDVQKDVYLAKLALDPYINGLSKLVQYTKIDTRKHGKSLIEQSEYLRKYEELLKQEDNVFDVNSIERLVKKSWIDYKTRRAINHVRSILQSQTFTANPYFIYALDQVCESLDVSGSDRKKKISQHMITMIKNRFIMQYAEDIGLKQFNNLFVGKNSIHSLLNRLKFAINTRPEFEHLKYNYLINNLICNPISEPIYYNGVRYESPCFVTISQNINNDKVESDLLSESWNDLLNDSNKNVARFAQLLIVYSYITSGEFAGWNKMFKYVPFEWKKSVQLKNGEYKNLTFNQFVQRELSDLASLGEFEHIADQIAMNNFLNTDIVPRLNLNKPPVGITGVDRHHVGTHGMMAFTIRTPKDYVYKPYVTVRNGIRSKKQSEKYDLYKAVNARMGEVTYVKIPKRGYHDTRGYNIYEYDFACNFIPTDHLKLTEADLQSLDKQTYGLITPEILTDYYKIPAEYYKDTTSSKQNKWTKSKNKYTRESVANDPTTLYIFTDNTDRTSGGTAYPDGWYKQKYGRNGGYGSDRNPTSAIIRGLENAAPISTMRYFYKDHQGMTHPVHDPNSEARWHDKDFDEFKQVFDEEIEQIKRMWDTGKYKRILSPMGDQGSSPFFGSKLTAITPERTPKIYNYMISQFKELSNYVNNTTPVTNTTIDQVLDHLRSMGLHIMNRDNMKTFFENRSNEFVQEFIGKRARAKFEEQLIKARPDLATPEYIVDGISFIKDPFSTDDFISSKLDIITTRRLQEKGIIKEGIFSEWMLTDKGKEMAQISYPGINDVLNFLHSLEDNNENTVYIKTAIRWIANRSLNLPQDHTKAYQAFELARKKHLDLQKYSTLEELITSPEMQPKKKKKAPFDPDKAKTFSNKRTVTTEGGRVFTIYDVENTYEAQEEVCEAVAAHYEVSPWCLSTFTSTGEPTQSAKSFWNKYGGIKRRIAFENGKPVAFSSDEGRKPIGPQYEIDGRKLPETTVLHYERALFRNVGKNEFDPETFNYFIENGYIERNPNSDYAFYNDIAYRFTQKGKDAVKEIPSEFELEDREAWWDVEDRYPQNTLSDSIVSDKNTEPEAVDPHYIAVAEATGFNDTEAYGEWYEPYIDYETEGDEEELEEYDDLPFFMTPHGEVYGFVDKDDNIYLDENIISPEHPIHEYTHLWDRYIAKKNPQLWKRGIELMKQTPLWNKVANDPNYGLKWKSMQNMTESKLESLIASEVHSRLVGEEGAALLDELAEEKGQENIISKLKEWILEFWKELKATFSNWSEEDLNKLTLDDFTYMTVRDFAEGINPINANSTNLVITDNASTTAQKAREIGGIDTLRHPDQNGMHFGNPFSHTNYRGVQKVMTSVKEAVIAYEQWLRGEAYQDIEPERREWILNQIRSGALTGKPLVYYTEKVPDNSYGTDTYNAQTAPNHAHILQKLINEIGNTTSKFEYARSSEGRPNYEVSSRGDKRFSAMTATFAPGTTLFGHDVSGRTIESVYQHGVKQGDWATNNNYKTGAPKDKTIITGNTEDDSYRQGYLPLWQEWAKQNPQLIEELRQKAQGKVITDMFASTAVSQARALADILNSINETDNTKSQDAGTYAMQSGGAKGSDYYWGSIASEYGVGTVNHWYYGQISEYNAPYGNIEISKEDYEEGRHKVAQAAKDNWGYQYSTMKDDRLIRNWAQVKYADAIFAVGHVVGKGQRLFPSIADDKRTALQTAVQGGTGYAVQMAINEGKPVYVYDQVRKKWASNVNGKWEWMESAPKLTPRFAGIGTRGLNEDGKQAIRDVFENTFGKSKSFTQIKNVHNELIADLGGDEIAESEVRDTVQVAKKGISFDEALSTVNPIFTQEEIAQIKQGLNGKNLKVMSLSRYTDPAFFANEIIKFLEENAKKPFTDPTRVNAMEIWSKHDGEPIQKILKACKKYKVAPMVSFSITTLGDTALEKGVLKHTDLIPLISKLIENGDLDPRTTTVRIDPIFVGVTNMNDIRNVVNECKKLGIKKFVTSLMQSYDSHRGRFSRRVPNNRGGYYTEYRYDLVREETKNGEVIVKDKNGNILEDWKSDDRFVVEGINKALAEDGKSYDWEKYYGSYWSKRANRKEISFKPKQEYINEIGKVLLDIAKDPEIKLETCSFTIPGLKASACLDPLIIERITGVDVTRLDGTYDRDTSRPECMCYGCHGDFFRWNEKKCYSSCAYCYAGHSSDSNFKYYNEDGTIIDRPISRVQMDNVQANKPVNTLSTPSSPLQIYSDGSDIKGTGAIGYGSVFMYNGNEYGISGTEQSQEVKQLQEKFPNAKFSNPTMEMLALATTLEHFAKSGLGEHIQINQDYKGAVNYGKLWEYSEGSNQRADKPWKAKEVYIKHLVERCEAAIDAITANGGSVKINWVKGHQSAGTEQAKMNDAADRYAKSRDEFNNIGDAYTSDDQNDSKMDAISEMQKLGENIKNHCKGI